MKRMMAALLALVAALAHAQEWQRATPESQGMDSAALARLVEYGGNVRMDALVVVRNGKLVAEAYYAPFRADMLHRVNSTTKAVIGALTGIAIARGEFPATSTPALALFPGVVPSDSRWQQMTVQHLLDMTTGIDWIEPLSEAVPVSMMEMERSRDWTQYVLDRALKQAPGAGFHYNSGVPHLLGVAIARKTGQPLEQYAAEHLFKPLGIANWRWRKDPQQNSTGGYGLYLHTRDMARFGQLYLQRGEWNGKQVVPREWVDRVFASRVDMPFPGYRYADYWWTIPRRDAYFTVGFNNQLIAVLPKLGVVAAVNGWKRYPLEDLVTHLERAAASTTALPENAAAQDVLRQQAAAAASDKMVAPVLPAPTPFTRATWTIDDNRTGVRELTIDLAARPEPSYHVKLRMRDYAGAIGFDGRYGAGSDNGTPVFTTATWVDANSLSVMQRWPEEAASIQFTLTFKGDALEFTHLNQFGVGGTARGRRMP